MTRTKQTGRSTPVVALVMDDIEGCRLKALPVFHHNVAAAVARELGLTYKTVPIKLNCSLGPQDLTALYDERESRDDVGSLETNQIAEATLQDLRDVVQLLPPSAAKPGLYGRKAVLVGMADPSAVCARAKQAEARIEARRETDDLCRWHQREVAAEFEEESSRSEEVSTQRAQLVKRAREDPGEYDTVPKAKRTKT